MEQREGSHGLATDQVTADAKDQRDAAAIADAKPANVIWLASYPKTGNTWVRVILSAALYPGPDAPNMFETALPSFTKTFPYDGPVFDLLGQKTHLVKTHLHPRNVRMRRCGAKTIGVIGIRRHPLDVMLSAMNYATLRAPKTFFLNGEPKPVEQIIADGEFLHYIDVFQTEDGFPWFGGACAEFSLYRKRWRKHARGLPHHEIRYENLFADPLSEIAKLMEFLGLPSNEETVARLYAAADQRTAQNGRFFWKRRAYNFQEILPDDLIAAFHERCAAQIAAFGYPATP